ncbi:hypothetical protein [Ferrimonas pelagia]|uniref:Uncharacterized protein n=1 Tax=Ferrimonas pelagia TaxID=1177826 RepID=A0ABP9EW99_9GAMM
MGNQVKRKQRAKMKKKFSRVENNRGQWRNYQLNQKHKEAQQVAYATPQALELFASLPPYDPEFSAVPKIKDYCIENGGQDLLLLTALTYVQYGHWYTTGSDALLGSELIEAALSMITIPTFEAQFYGAMA